MTMLNTISLHKEETNKGDSWYYDFMNLNTAVQKCLIKGALPYEFHYFKDIVSTKISMFKYKNIEKIPDLTSQILEMAMMFCNRLCFYKKPGLGWILCRYVIGSEWNPYLRPQRVNLMAFNGESIGFDVPYEDIVLVRDNSMDIIPFLCINEYIGKIHTVEKTIFKILKISTLPLALTGNKKVMSQFKTAAKALTGDDPLVGMDDSLVDKVQAFNIDVPVQPLDLYELKQKYRNECLSSLGIYSVEEKRERIVTQELVNQNDYTDFVYQDAKMERQRIIDELNRRDPSLQLELVEVYEVNVKESNDEEADKAYKVAKAEAKADPDKDKGGFGNEV